MTNVDTSLAIPHQYLNSKEAPLLNAELDILLIGSLASLLGRGRRHLAGKPAGPNPETSAASVVLTLQEASGLQVQGTASTGCCIARDWRLYKV